MVKSLPPRGSSIGTLVQRAPKAEAVLRSSSVGAAPWRPLYKKARWVKLRLTILLRDEYACCQTGAVLMGKYPAPSSPVVDHIIPAHVFWFDGRQHLFWDPDNLQSVSKAYHDSEKQRLERSIYG